MIVLHVGAGKCGSSALQRFLSSNPELDIGDGKKIYYHVLTKKGILSGDRIRKLAKKSLRGYLSSKRLKTIVSIDNTSAFNNLSNEDIHVFSAEGWIRDVHHKKEMDLFLNQFNQQVVILMYVRPQVPLLNSAYWQWGAWVDQDPKEWIMNYTKKASKWYNKYEAFRELENVEECKVRILSGDIVTDFLSLFGEVDIGDSNNISNKSLSGELLRIMQRNRQLRPNADASLIDFFFEKYFSGIGGKTPWIIDKELASWIINESYSDNKKLLEILDVEQAKLMSSDKRWWNIYSVDSEVESANPIPAKDKVGEDLLVRAVELLMEKEDVHFPKI